MVLAPWQMPLALSKIWTRVTVSISNADKQYTSSYVYATMSK